MAKGGGHELMNEVWREVWARKSYAPYRGLMRRAVPFSLDTASTRLVTELASNANKCELYRHLARLPYEVIWLEFDYLEKVRTQIKLGTRTNPYKPGHEPERMGYLIERLSETRWRALSWAQIRVTDDDTLSPYRLLADNANLKVGDAFIETMPPMFILDTEGRVDGYRTVVRDASLHLATQEYANNSAGPCGVAWGLGIDDDDRNAWRVDTGIYAMAPSLTGTVTIDLPPDWEASLMRMNPTPHKRRDGLRTIMSSTISEQAGLMRLLCAALASITSAPTVIRDSKPKGHFRADGRLREYKVNRVVTLHVPGKRTITAKNVLKYMAGAKRRMARHQVHGFWRTSTAQNSPGSRWQWLYSQRHRAYRWHIWIDDFERGDATLGYVLREYEVKT